MTVEKPPVGIFHYPHFGRIAQIRNKSRLLGHDIYWTLKEDGSNAGIFLNEKNEGRVLPRNADVADYCVKVRKLPAFQKIVEMLKFQKSNYGLDAIVFGEFLQKGTSPTRLKQYDHDDFIVFDMWDRNTNRFIPWNNTCLLCGTSGISVVDTLGYCKCSTLDELYAFRDKMLLESGELTIIGGFQNGKHTQITFALIDKDKNIWKTIEGDEIVLTFQNDENFTLETSDSTTFVKYCPKNEIYIPIKIYAKAQESYDDGLFTVFDVGSHVTMNKISSREGVVGKIYHHVDGISDNEFVMFKEKHYLPKPKHISISTEQVQLPALPEEDVWACVAKVKNVMGEEFNNIKSAMPKIVEEINKECKQQNCRFKGEKLSFYYHKTLEDMMK